MINSKDRFIVKIVEQLEKEAGFTEDELFLIEEYLSGNKDDEALAELEWQDLSQIDASEIHSIYMELIDAGRNQDAEKLGRLFFAIGEASSHELYMNWNYNWKEALRPLKPDQKAAVYASYIGDNEYRVSAEHFGNLLKAAGNDAANVKKALEYRTGEAENGLLVLFTAYFLLKYPKLEPGAEIRLEEADLALMKSYEDALMGAIPKIFPGLSKKDEEEILNAAGQDRMDGSILNRIPTAGVDSFWLCLAAGAAFVNFALSPRLKNVASICLAGDWESALEDMEDLDLRHDMGKLGSRFDEIFQMDVKNYIAWAASEKKSKILKEQFAKNRETYLQCMDAADYETYNYMASTVKKMAPELFRQRVEGEIDRQQSKLIDSFVNQASAQLSPAADDMRMYLSGQGGIEHLNACKEILKGCYYWGSRVRGELTKYQVNYGYDDFSNRCETLLLAGHGLGIYEFFGNKKEKHQDVAERIFAAADSEGLDLASQLNAYAYLYDSGYQEKHKQILEKVVKEAFRGHLANRREETLDAFRKAGSAGRCFGLQLMAESAEEYKENILSFAQDTAKSVKETLLPILYQKKEWEAEIAGLLSSKKAAEREMAVHVIAKWKEEADAISKKASVGADVQKGEEASAGADVQKGEGNSVGNGKLKAEEYVRILTGALEKEKNVKVKTLLEGILNVSAEVKEDGAVSRTDLVKELHKGNKKRSLAWAYETPFSKVHKKDGTEAEEEYLQAICLCYSTMSPYGVNPSAASLAETLNEREFAVYVNELFDKWLEAGAESKKRWVMYAAVIHGGDDIVKKLYQQIQEWPKEARGAIATEAVQALALSPTPQGLLLVDGISRKFKFKQVKAGAVKALEFAASQLGITTEELADRIVPNLGFDENMQRVFDYGPRKFTVTITPALEIEVFDESGKKLKNLPSPGKRDDEVKAAEAYEDFKQMKKQMKTTVSSQKMRLEMALSTERMWSVKAWKDLFVKNPIMHQFAIGLIWGVYEDRKLVTSFRYMEDGSFNTEDEEEIVLSEEDSGQGDSGGQSGSAGSDVAAGQEQVIGRDRCIGLVHPIELSEESIKTWKEQLEDYEIIQPIEQLDRQIFYITEEEKAQKSLDRFGGLIVNDLSLGGKLTAQGWYRGSVEDGGGFYTYYREDKELGLGAVLHFSGTYVGGENSDVTVYETLFFKAGELVIWSYDKGMEKKACALGEIPERYFSEVVLQIAKAAASNSGKNENWKNRR